MFCRCRAAVIRLRARRRLRCSSLQACAGARLTPARSGSRCLCCRSCHAGMLNAAGEVLHHRHHTAAPCRTCAAPQGHPWACVVTRGGRTGSTPPGAACRRPALWAHRRRRLRLGSLPTQPPAQPAWVSGRCASSRARAAAAAARRLGLLQHGSPESPVLCPAEQPLLTAAAALTGGSRAAHARMIWEHSYWLAPPAPAAAAAGAQQPPGSFRVEGLRFRV